MMAAAVVVGLVLLNHTDDPSRVRLTSRPTSTTTTVPRSTTTTTPATTTTVARHEPASLKVLVMNGVNKKLALAGPDAKALVKAGYPNTTSKDAANTVSKSVVYVVPGYEGDGTAVASLLGIPAAAVKALPTPLPPEVGNPGDAQIIVVLGPDAPVSTG